MLAAEKVAAPERAVPGKLEANQEKDRATLEKVVEVNKAALEADQWKLTEFEKSLSGETRKLEANQYKWKALKATVEADQVKLQASQEKLQATRRR